MSSREGPIDPGHVVSAALLDAGLTDPDTAEAFGALFSRFSNQRKRETLSFDKILPPSLVDYESMEVMPGDERLQSELLNKVAILKLNGGLGTSMGCRGPKAAIPIRNGLTFLDLTVRQVEYLNTRHGVDIPLVLMNSFRTHDVTVRLLSRYAHHHVTIHCFSQSCFPRLDRDTFMPVPVEPFSPSTESAWYPPGHGDVFRALEKSGVLDKLLATGKEIVLVSNVDNLCATLDLRLLYHLVNQRIPFAMEVTTRQRQDVQGGTLVEYEGKPRLLEASQVPYEHQEEFKSLKRFRNWCTNNLWVSLKEAKAALAGGILQSPVIVNERTIGAAFLDHSGGGGGNSSSGSGSGSGSSSFTGGVGDHHPAKGAPTIPVLELETAAGAAIEYFPGAIGVLVPRSRFLPVKNTGDLFAVQSNLYDLRHGVLYMSGLRSIPTPPLIRLGPEFSFLENYTERVLSGGSLTPDILEADHISITGNVFFGRGVVMRGAVVVVCSEGDRIDIPPNSLLENVVVTGSLRILSM